MTTNKERVQVYVSPEERQMLLEQIKVFNAHRMLNLKESQFYLMCVRKELRNTKVMMNNKIFLERQLKANASRSPTPEESQR